VRGAVITGVTTAEFLTALVFGFLGFLLIRRGTHVVGICLVVVATLSIASSAPAQYVEKKVNSLVTTLVA
jgi:hypothetical protein